MLVERLSALGIRTLAADETVVLIELGPRGPEIFRELSGDALEPDGAEPVGWLLVDASIAGEADAAVNALAELLPRYPELRTRPEKERAF